MIAFGNAFSGLSVERDQIVFIGYKNCIYIGKNKICQAFVGAFISPQRLAVFRVDGRDAIRVFFLLFAVF